MDFVRGGPSLGVPANRGPSGGTPRLAGAGGLACPRSGARLGHRRGGGNGSGRARGGSGLRHGPAMEPGSAPVPRFFTAPVSPAG